MKKRTVVASALSASALTAGYALIDQFTKRALYRERLDKENRIDWYSDLGGVKVKIKNHKNQERKKIMKQKTKKIDEQLKARQNLKLDTNAVKIIENNKTIKKEYLLNSTVENALYTFVQTVINKQSVLTFQKKTVQGLEFSYSKFLNVAIDWNNKAISTNLKSVEIVRILDKVFKKYYLEISENTNIMPVLFLTRENSIVIRLLKYDSNFYKFENENKKRTEKKVSELILSNSDIVEKCKNKSYQEIENLIKDLEDLKKTKIVINKKIA